MPRACIACGIYFQNLLLVHLDFVCCLTPISKFAFHIANLEIGFKWIG